MERLLKAVKPLFYVSRILGLAPYSLSGNGKLTVHLPALVYSILINVIVISLPVCYLVYAGISGNVPSKYVLEWGMAILCMATLLTNALSASLTLFRCRSLINIYSDILYLCSIIEDVSPVFHKSLTTVINLLLLGCVPYCIFYAIFCGTLDIPKTGILFTPILFIILYCPFVIIVQFASLILLSMRLLSYINTRLSETLTEVSFPERDKSITLTSPDNHFPPAKLDSRRSYFLVASSKRTPQRSHVSGISPSSTENSVLPNDATPHIIKEPTGLISPGIISHLRLQILSLTGFHDDLCDTVRRINTAYSERLLVNVADAFICLTVSLFCSYFMPMQQNHGVSICLFLLIIYWGLMKLLVLLYACTSYTEEVSKVSDACKKC
jgi:hypothetical protein